MEGEVIRTKKTGKKEQFLYKIHGNWNRRIYITKYPDDCYTQNAKLDDKNKELIFEKTAYPENW